MNYNIERSKSKRGIRASIDKDGAVLVVAGYQESDEDIARFLYQHRRWISIHQKSARDRMAYRERYMGTRLILLHGKPTPVVYIDGDFSYHYDGETLTIHTHMGERESLDRALFEYADSYFHEMFTRYAHDIVKMNVKKVKTYYGICYRKASKSSYINLNMHLIHADDECIRYVIYHEITHLTVPNHGREFYRRLGEIEPNHRQIKARLREIVRVTE